MSCVDNGLCDQLYSDVDRIEVDRLLVNFVKRSAGNLSVGDIVYAGSEFMRVGAIEGAGAFVDIWFNAHPMVHLRTDEYVIVANRTAIYDRIHP